MNPFMWIFNIQGYFCRPCKCISDLKAKTSQLTVPKKDFQTNTSKTQCPSNFFGNLQILFQVFGSGPSDVWDPSHRPIAAVIELQCHGHPLVIADLLQRLTRLVRKQSWKQLQDIWRRDGQHHQVGLGQWKDWEFWDDFCSTNVKNY